MNKIYEIWTYHNCLYVNRKLMDQYVNFFLDGSIGIQIDIYWKMREK
jgi:hypothetical protein